MMSQATYKLPDEPSPGVMQHLVVNPMWPLFAVMFAGAWMAFPWFLFNAYAIGSPTRVKESLIVVLGTSTVVALIYCMLSVYGHFGIADTYMKYGFQVVVLCKLGFAYWLFLLQGRTFEIYEHFNGKVSNGLLPLLAATIFLRKRVLDLSDSPLWAFLVS